MNDKFESLKKEHEDLMPMEEVSLVYLGAFFSKELARTIEQSEFLINLALTESNVMSEIIKVLEKYYYLNKQENIAEEMIDNKKIN